MYPYCEREKERERVDEEHFKAHNWEKGNDLSQLKNENKLITLTCARALQHLCKLCLACCKAYC